MASTYVTSQGETWDSIAKAIWGNETLMDKLMAVNSAHLGTVVFSAGVILEVPDVDTSTIETVTPPWKS